jgi:hypothetical protein
MSAKKPVILFMDEVDYITPGSPTSREWQNDFNPFWRNLRVAYQESTRAQTRCSILFGHGISPMALS